ncbi:MAG: type IV pilus biogenesis/stability protein PilW [Pseudomonadota bacterium]|nr:type IV pilus biogenesis/stability protein PilW [Pseudomonadota bacterium]
MATSNFFRYRALVIVGTLSLIAGCSSTPKAPEPPPRTPPPQQQQASPAERARMHTDLAGGYYERAQMSVAIEELNVAVANDPGYAPAYNLFGLVYAVLGDDRKAEQSFQRALELAPNDSDVHHNWGWYLCQHKREREALGQFEIAVQNSLYRTPEIALVNAGRCAQTIGEVRLAETYFRRALGAQPGNALASYGVALIAYKEARYEEARQWMRPVMQTNTPPPEAIYLGLCIERKLGDRQAELSYISQLRNRFPDSIETKAITTEACE